MNRETNTKEERHETVLRKKKQKKLLLIAGAVVLLIVGIIVWICISKGRSNAVMEGTWVYDAYTQYEFDDEGRGCMCLEDLHYEYTYTVTDKQLWLDFVDESVRDCVYEFSVKGDTLTLIGGEGTVGGEYELYRQESNE